MADSWFDEYKPGAAMVLVQLIATCNTLAARAVFSHGVNPMIFTVYRQAVATVVMVPLSLLATGPKKMALGLRAFALVFVASLVGCTLNQYLYYHGLSLTSSSMGSAMNNVIPAFTFLMATFFGLEKLKLRCLRSMAKILGTIICVGGAISMAFYKGPKLLNVQIQTLTSILHAVNDQWIMGFIYLIGSTFCGSLWLILQVPICEKYLDPLSLATWMCIMSTFQSAALAYSLEQNLQAWKITSVLELLAIIYTGIFASGAIFYLQSWVISVRDPVFSALFNPVQIVIATILGFLLLHEELHIGSLVGAVAVVGGLYIVLWGKAKDLSTKGKLNSEEDFTKIVISIDAQLEDDKDDMQEPLLAERSDNIKTQIKSSGK